MNNIYKVVFCKATQTFQAVSEFAKGQGKSSIRTTNTSQNKKLNFKLSTLSLALATLLCGQSVYAAEGVNGLVQVSSTSGSASASAGRNAIAIGKDSISGHNSTVAIGLDAQSTAHQSTALGLSSRAIATETLALGAYTTASGSQSIAIGNDIHAKGNRTIVIGTTSQEYPRPAGKTGHDMSAVWASTGDNAIAIGSGTSRRNNKNVVAQVKGDYSIALGTSTITEEAAEDSLALGHGAKVSNIKGIAIGGGGNSNDDTESTVVTGDKAIAIGSAAKATKAKAVALGSDSNTATNATAAQQVSINGVKFGKDGATPFAGTVTDVGMQVSVGKKGKERQIKNVGAGVISDTSTDAINGSQLYAVMGKIKPETPIVVDAANGTVNEPANPTGVATAGDIANAINSAGWILQEKGTKKDLVTAGNVVNFIDGIGTTVSVDNSTTDKTKIKYDIKVAPNSGLSVGPDGLQVDVDDETITKDANGKITAKKGDIAENADGTTSAGSNPNALTTAQDVSDAINAASHNLKNKNTDLDVTADASKTAKIKAGSTITFEAGKNLVSKLDENGLIQVSTAKEVKFDNVQVGDVVISKDAGIDAGNKKITGVAAGDVSPTSTDAVNGSQLDAVAKAAKEDVKSDDGSVTVVKTQAADGSNIFDLSVKVDEDTMEFVPVDPNDPTKGKKLAPKTADLTPKADGTIAEPTGKDAKKLATAGDIAKAINGASHKIKATNTDVVATATDGEKVMKAGEELTLEAGKNLNIQKEGDKFVLSTANKVEFEEVKAGPVAINNDGMDAGDTKITGVAAGDIADDSKEAVNGSQIKGISDSIANALGGNTTVNPDGTISAPTFNLTDDSGSPADGKPKKAYNSVGDALTAIDKAVNKPITFKGDEANESEQKLGSTFEILAGNAKDTSTKNLKTKVEANKVTISMAEKPEFKKVTATEGVTIGEGDTAIDMTPSQTTALDKNGNPSNTVPAVDMAGSTFTGVASNLPATTSEGSAPTKTQAAPNVSEAQKTNVATLGDVLNAGWNLETAGNRPDGSTRDDKVDFVKPYDTVEFEAGAGLYVENKTDGKKSIVKFRKAGTDEVDAMPRDGVAGTNNGAVIIVPSESNGNGLISAKNVAKAINNSGWWVTSDVEGTGTRDGKPETKTDELVHPSEKVTFKAGDNLVIKQEKQDFTYSLAKEIEVDSIKAGPVKIDAKGIDAGNTKITNVAPGTNPNDAVNFSQLKNLRDDLDKASDEGKAGIAGSSAMAMLGHARDSGESAISAGVAFHEGQGAFAVGVSAWSDNGHWLLKGAAAVDTQAQTTVGASATYNWD